MKERGERRDVNMQHGIKQLFSNCKTLNERKGRIRNKTMEELVEKT